MCAELQEVFGMSINSLPLPFPLKDGATAALQPSLDRTAPSSSRKSSSSSAGGALQNVEEQAEEVSADWEVENTRRPRDSEVGWSIC